MKHPWITALTVSLILSACGGDSGTSSPGAGTPGASGNLMAVAADGSTSVQASTLATALASLPAVPLSDAEAASLSWMREEEKLAHDVYVKLHDQWGVQVFSNIAASEATHTAAVLTLIERYQLPDPAAGKAAGVFANTTLQGLYDTLVAKGQASVIDALLVGAEIEELDIRDIETQKQQIDNADILTVYDNLLLGSRNHLRTFVKVLAQYSVSYTPRYLGAEAYAAIVGTGTETGR